MKFNKLRLLGFKSFVEPTEFLIEEGLTGIVGPNGCGKSNLVEALRWVMGENSYKNMRASGMDDVIFSGSGNRPSRNSAEVTLFLDNADRTAPAAFNDDEELQVSRRIERESGSAYRINGKEVRAKDVQLLFADASTGARSPSMVGQGRIGELISAKPQARRALLEEAAGISGLHSRRHDAELRLRAADQNLERLEDVVGQLDSQLDSLKRQARQANRYRTISDDIRKTGALAFHLRWTAAKTAEAEAESRLSQAATAVGERAQLQGEAAKEQAVLAHQMPGHREAEAKAAAALQRLTMARNQIDEELARIAARREELENRIAQLHDDIAREEKLVSENSEILSRLDAEETDLIAKSRAMSDTEASSKQQLAEVSAKLTASEGRLGELTATVAETNTRKSLLERSIKDATDRRRRLDEQAERVEAELKQVAAEIARLGGDADLQNRAALLEKRVADAEADLAAAEEAAERAQAGEQEARPLLAELKQKLGAIETEARTLNRILNQGGQDMFPAVVERVHVEPGFEKALGAALGEDLDVSTEASAPVRWHLLDDELEAGSLPAGAKCLADVVTAPAELKRRLSQIGVVDRASGNALQVQLKPGQRLVSLEGDLWRWDGFQATSEAPTAAAQRLAQKNRLAELDREAIEATRGLREAEGLFEQARQNSADKVEAARNAREAWRAAQKELGETRDAISAAERAAGQFTARRSALEEARNRLADDAQDALALYKEAESQLAAIADVSALEGELQALKSEVAEDRARLAEVRADFDGLSREAEARGRRLETIKTERADWQRRVANASGQIEQLTRRRETAQTELASIEDGPAQAEARRRELSSQIEQAEADRQKAADVLAEAENRLAEADKRARDTIVALSEAREESARAEERVSAARERRGEIEERIREELECQPHETLSLAQLEDSGSLPELSSVEARLEKLKSERERLGAVNLRAELEQTEVSEQRDALILERDDLVEAIRRLRAGIGSLNKEGRERLLEAFDVVNGQFQRLFTHLFGGGTAELQLIESDDPLEAGLEILARPPGKKPQTMTLLSGGEQALTAMALIFAVFLTNPAPICVLDEVDAPLDDHNVERFCNLMDEMASSTDTRFVIITHNPITMARMNRLFGVTMAERGVSKMVSVDLQEAERIREAS
ncbi:MAG: chromosome segregation protein SMC [Phyllobacteriaceae bacterium]|nr:chromosome segregation protein SMC [Phyllobacteriaceae bacterium]